MLCIHTTLVLTTSSSSSHGRHCASWLWGFYWEDPQSFGGWGSPKLLHNGVVVHLWDMYALLLGASMGNPNRQVCSSPSCLHSYGLWTQPWGTAGRPFAVENKWSHISTASTKLGIFPNLRHALVSHLFKTSCPCLREELWEQRYQWVQYSRVPLQ